MSQERKLFGLMFDDRISFPPNEILQLISSPPPVRESEPTGQLETLYRASRSVSDETPAKVDQFLLDLLMALDEWLSEHSEEHPYAPRVIELVDAILEHFQACWDAARVQRLLALCCETLAALLEQPSRRERWW